MLHISEINEFYDYLIENKIAAKRLKNGGIHIGRFKFNPNKDYYIKFNSSTQYLETCYNVGVRVEDYKFWILDKHIRKEEHKVMLYHGYKLYKYLVKGQIGLLVYARESFSSNGFYVRNTKEKIIDPYLELKDPLWFKQNHITFEPYYLK